MPHSAPNKTTTVRSRDARTAAPLPQGDGRHCYAKAFVRGFASGLAFDGTPCPGIEGVWGWKLRHTVILVTLVLLALGSAGVVLFV